MPPADQDYLGHLDTLDDTIPVVPEVNAEPGPPPSSSASSVGEPPAPEGVPNPGLAVAGGLPEPMPEDRVDDVEARRNRNPIVEEEDEGPGASVEPPTIIPAVTKAQPVPVKAAPK